MHILKTTARIKTCIHFSISLVGEIASFQIVKHNTTYLVAPYFCNMPETHMKKKSYCKIVTHSNKISSKYLVYQNNRTFYVCNLLSLTIHMCISTISYFPLFSRLNEICCKCSVNSKTNSLYYLLTYASTSIVLHRNVAYDYIM